MVIEQETMRELIRSGKLPCLFSQLLVFWARTHHNKKNAASFSAFLDAPLAYSVLETYALKKRDCQLSIRSLNQMSFF